MPYFFSNNNIVNSSVRRTLISESNIVTTKIDMNHEKITSLQDPSIGQDAATKHYVDKSLMKVTHDVDTFVESFTGFTIDLIGTDWTEVAYLKAGSFIVSINPYDDGNCTLCASVSKSSNYVAGHISIITQSPGTYTKERLQVQSPVNGSLMIRKTGFGCDGKYSVDLSVKNLSSVKNPPVNNTDQATIAYVNERVNDQLNQKFGGIPRTLSGVDNTTIINLKPGSYTVNVSALSQFGSPTASFSVSKNSNSTQAVIVKTTSCPGLNSIIELELTWNENSMMMLKKTGMLFDGVYVVDLGHANYSSVPPPTIPSDAATIEYVEQAIDAKMQAQFGGTVVNLVNTDVTSLGYLPSGSYIIAVSPKIDGGPSATFAISRNSPYGIANITKTSFVDGAATGETLMLTWGENSVLFLKKSASFYDGQYVIDFNLKNISLNPIIPQIDSDFASKAFVEHEIDDRMQVSFGGKMVHLVDTQYSEVDALRSGSYLISISGDVEGAPTGSFLVSKSKQSNNASITSLNFQEGYQTAELLELTWNPNEKLKVRKTGPFYDSFYMVDFNLKNFSSVNPTPLLSTDVASKQYVTESIDTKITQKYSGFEVYLTDDDWTPVVAMQAGSFIFTVSPMFDGGATATFSVSKSSSLVVGIVSRTTFSPGYQTGEEIVLKWGINEKIMVRKTGPFHNGFYRVDDSLKNLSTLQDPPVNPTDTVDLATVQQMIANAIQDQSNGISVSLSGILFSGVSALKHGSYVISISPVDQGGPTSVFSISKNEDIVDANILKHASHSARDDPLNEIEVTWNANETLKVRKTGLDFNGSYVVNFNIKNFTAI